MSEMNTQDKPSCRLTSDEYQALSTIIQSEGDKNAVSDAELVQSLQRKGLLDDNGLTELTVQVFEAIATAKTAVEVLNLNSNGFVDVQGYIAQNNATAVVNNGNSDRQYFACSTAELMYFCAGVMKPYTGPLGDALSVRFPEGFISAVTRCDREKIFEILSQAEQTDEAYVKGIEDADWQVVAVGQKILDGQGANIYSVHVGKRMFLVQPESDGSYTGFSTAPLALWSEFTALFA